MARYSTRRKIINILPGVAGLIFRLGILVVIFTLILWQAKNFPSYIRSILDACILKFLILSCLFYVMWFGIDVMLLRKKLIPHRIWKIFLCYIGVYLLSLLSLGLFITYHDSHTFKFLWNLERAKSHNQETIYLSNLTDFSWEKVCFIPPYTIEDDIQKLIGQEYKIGEIDTNDDGLYNLLFLLPDKTTRAIQVSRNFYQLNARPCLNYEESKTVKMYY